MRYYETLYIVNPNFEGERLDAVIKEVGDQIAGFEGVAVINHRVWGKKRLAYTIQNHKYGTYVLLQFEADTGAFLRDFEMFLKLDKNIVRSQTIRLDEKPEEITVDGISEDDTEEITEKEGIDSSDEDDDESTDDAVEETPEEPAEKKKAGSETSEGEADASSVEEKAEAEATEETEASDTSRDEAEEKTEE